MITATKRKTVAEQLIEWLAKKKTSELEKTKTQLLEVTSERDIAVNSFEEVIKATAEAGVIKLPKKKDEYKELITETVNTVSSEVCSSLSLRISKLESRMEETIDIVCEIRDLCNNSAEA